MTTMVLSRAMATRLLVVLAIVTAMLTIPGIARADSKTATNADGSCRVTAYMYRTYSSSAGHRVGAHTIAYCNKSGVVNSGVTLTRTGASIKSRSATCAVKAGVKCRTPTVYQKNPGGSQKFCVVGTVDFNTDVTKSKAVSFCRSW